MAKVGKALFIFFAVIGLLVFAVAIVLSSKSHENPLDIDEELVVVLHSNVFSELEKSKDYYLVYAGAIEKPVRVEVDSVIFKYNSDLEKPRAKMWLGGKKVAYRAEIWFKNRDQFREYLR